MGILTDDMKLFVREQWLGFVATVSADGTPNLSPKGSIRTIGDDDLVFADIRSPQTIDNIARQPVIEINVVDVLSRKGYRFRGTASVHSFDSDAAVYKQCVAHLRAEGVTNSFERVVLVRLTGASAVLSPAYDTAATEAQIRAEWCAYWEQLCIGGR